MALDQWFYDLKGIFIIGQGLSYNSNSSDNLVPTFGNIPSDNMLTADIKTFDYRPRVPIGRLAAITPEEVRQFFNSIPKNDRPVFGTELRVSQIVVYPTVSQQEKQNVINRLKDFKADVIDLSLIHISEPQRIRRRSYAE